MVITAITLPCTNEDMVVTVATVATEDITMTRMAMITVTTTMDTCTMTRTVMSITACRKLVMKVTTLAKRVDILMADMVDMVVMGERDMDINMDMAYKKDDVVAT